MKSIKKMCYPFIFIIMLSSILSCSSDDNANTNPQLNSSINKIMPLGASRVEGARPEYESYRYELWKLLIEANYEFDFVGTETDNASYPDVNGVSFDRDHEGRGGITSGGILEDIDIWLSDLGTVPDIVLFSSPGGNDGIDNLEQSIVNINAIIDRLQAINSNMTIIIELPAPPLTNEQTEEFLTYYNQALQAIPEIAQQQTTATSNVIVIDMMTGFEDSFLADDVHYNEAGAIFVANRYFEVLTDLLQ